MHDVSKASALADYTNTRVGVLSMTARAVTAKAVSDAPGPYLKKQPMYHPLRPSNPE